MTWRTYILVVVVLISNCQGGGKGKYSKEQACFELCSGGEFDSPGMSNACDVLCHDPGLPIHGRGAFDFFSKGGSNFASGLEAGGNRFGSGLESIANGLIGNRLRNRPDYNGHNDDGDININIDGTHLDMVANNVGSQIESGAKRVGPQIEAGANRVGNQLDRGAKRVGGHLEKGANRFGKVMENSGVGNAIEGAVHRVGQQLEPGINTIGGHIDNGANRFGDMADIQAQRFGDSIGGYIKNDFGPKSEAHMNKWGPAMAQKLFPEKFAKHYGRSAFFPGKLTRRPRSPHNPYEPEHNYPLREGYGHNAGWDLPDAPSGRSFFPTLPHESSGAHKLPAGIEDGVDPGWFDSDNSPESESSEAYVLPGGIEDGVDPGWFNPKSYNDGVTWAETSSPALGTSKAVPPITKPGTYGLAGRATKIHLFPILTQLNGGKPLFHYNEGVKVHKGKEVIDQEVESIDDGPPKVTKDVYKKQEQKYDKGFYFAVGRK